MDPSTGGGRRNLSSHRITKDLNRIVPDNP